MFAEFDKGDDPSFVSSYSSLRLDLPASSYLDGTEEKAHRPNLWRSLFIQRLYNEEQQREHPLFSWS